MIEWLGSTVEKYWEQRHGINPEKQRQRIAKAREDQPQKRRARRDAEKAIWQNSSTEEEDEPAAKKPRAENEAGEQPRLHTQHRAGARPHQTEESLSLHARRKAERLDHQVSKELGATTEASRYGPYPRTSICQCSSTEKKEETAAQGRVAPVPATQANGEETMKRGTSGRGPRLGYTGRGLPHQRTAQQEVENPDPQEGNKEQVSQKAQPHAEKQEHAETTPEEENDPQPRGREQKPKSKCSRGSTFEARNELALIQQRKTPVGMHCARQNFVVA